MTDFVNDALHLENAPIVEAIIDFRIKPREGLTVKDLESLRHRISAKYTTFNQTRIFKAEIGFKDGSPVPPSMAHTLLGYRCESADKLYILQAHLDGFTISRLPPYETWASLRDEARWLWNEYVATVQPESILRTAVRYINRLELNYPLDFDDYLTCPPRIPPKLPQTYAGFVSRVVVPCGVDGVQVAISQALEAASPTSLKVSVILDIDAFLEYVYDVNDGGYWETLEKLRVLKNQAFFGSITNKAVELYK